MDVQKQEFNADGIKFIIEENGQEVARAYLYLLKNDLHDRPFGFMEDVFVEEASRGKGYGTAVLNALIEEARRRCYKLICTSRHSRPQVHEWYKSAGFKEQGLEFRMDF